jgi:hypothetical protein
MLSAGNGGATVIVKSPQAIRGEESKNWVTALDFLYNNECPHSDLYLLLIIKMTKP